MPPLDLNTARSTGEKKSKKRKKSKANKQQSLSLRFEQPGPVNVKVTKLDGDLSIKDFNSLVSPNYSGGRSSIILQSDPEEIQRRAEREHRFQRPSACTLEQNRAGETLLEARRRQGTAEGTNCKLEKHYLRLTSAPDRASVRPPAVLERALQAVKEKWLQGAPYLYASDQLKAMRQDLLVQNIREMLAVEIYETHARVAIEVNDWAEFNQCQSMLKQLYQEQDPEEGSSVAISASEFAAYRLLHSCSISSRAYQAELLDQSKSHLLQHEFTRHALQVCRAFHMNAYSTFVSLYEGAPRMCPYLMDILAPKLQVNGMSTMIKAYLPTLPVQFIMLQLGVNNPLEMEDLKEQTNAVFQEGLLDTKASRYVQGTNAACL